MEMVAPTSEVRRASALTMQEDSLPACALRILP
jgi:hypothetical protein